MSDDGGYQLLKKIAAGGMAEVFLARADSDESLVVVKRMLPQFSRIADYVEMFFDEGRVVSLLRHPNIVRMREFGFQNDQPFLAMEYLDGLDLHKLLKLLRQRHQRLPLACALYIVACMSAGLHHTHDALSIDGRAMGIIHRDVSPHNVVLTTMGEVKLIDFGIAKSVVREHATKGGTLKGKVRYMSPEQLRGLELDRRSDIYALGVMLYELAVGRSPYFDETTKGEPVGEFGLMMAVTSQSVHAPTGVPLALAHVIQKAMATGPAQRYQTCAELILALEAVAEIQGLHLHAAPLMQLINEFQQFQNQEARAAHRQGGQDATVVADDWYEVAAIDESVAPRVVASIEVSTLAQLDAATIARPSIQANALHDSRRAAVLTVPPSRSPYLLAQPVDVQAVQGIPALQVISIAGDNAAAMQQIANASTMEGGVLFDFGRVVKFPLECIRAWLDFHETNAARPQPAAVFFGSCGPALVKQAARARSILGQAQVVSLGVPCQCLTCGESFEHVVDCERDVDVLQGPILSWVACLFCGGRANCDDDSSFRVVSSAFWGRPVPNAVRLALTAVVAQRRNLEIVEKTIEGQHTQIRVRSAIDGHLRWSRIFDGLEGDVTLDLALAQFDDAAIAGLQRALPALAAQVHSLTLCGVPHALVVSADPIIAKLRFESVACRCFCSVCAAPRLCVTSAVDWRHMVGAGELAIVCPGCRSELRPSAASLEGGGVEVAVATTRSSPGAAAPKRQRATLIWSAVAVVAVVTMLLVWMVLT